MITIRNIGGDPFGISRYEVCINKEHIAFFEHDRTDGLYVCMKKAADAAEKSKWLNFSKMLLEGEK